MQFVVFEKICECLFQIAREKSIDYLLIIYMKKFFHADWWKNFEMVEQKEHTPIMQSGKNCAIQGVRLIWKQKIWLPICEFVSRLSCQSI